MHMIHLRSIALSITHISGSSKNMHDSTENHVFLTITFDDYDDCMLN